MLCRRPFLPTTLPFIEASLTCIEAGRQARRNERQGGARMQDDRVCLSRSASQWRFTRVISLFFRVVPLSGSRDFLLRFALRPMTIVLDVSTNGERF
eukprot:3263059-Rhodomonas_salina.4